MKAPTQGLPKSRNRTRVLGSSSELRVKFPQLSAPALSQGSQTFFSPKVFLKLLPMNLHQGQTDHENFDTSAESNVNARLISVHVLEIAWHFDSGSSKHRRY